MQEIHHGKSEHGTESRTPDYGNVTTDANEGTYRYGTSKMRKIKDRGNIHGAEKIAVMAALNITHDMLRKSRRINETRHVTVQLVKGLEDRIDAALAESRQLEI